MPNVFLATLGQRPEAITVALDLLLARLRPPTDERGRQRSQRVPREPLETVAILHTEPEHSGIAPSLKTLKRVLAADYSELDIRYHEIRRADGGPLMDLIDYDTCMDYYQGVYATLLDFKKSGHTLHLLIAGGRKAMSAYATLSATIVFGEYDRLWTVVSPGKLVDQPGSWHVPPELRDQVHLVDIPLPHARIDVEAVPFEVLRDLTGVLTMLQNRRQTFLNRLSDAEKRVAGKLQEFPDATDAELAEMLGLTPKGVQSQLYAIYREIDEFYDLGVQIAHKRQALLRLLQGGEISREE